MFSYYTAISCRQNRLLFVSLLGNHCKWLGSLIRPVPSASPATIKLRLIHWIFHIPNTNGTNWVEGRGKLVQIRVGWYAHSFPSDTMNDSGLKVHIHWHDSPELTILVSQKEFCTLSIVYTGTQTLLIVTLVSTTLVPYHRVRVGF